MQMNSSYQWDQNFVSVELILEQMKRRHEINFNANYQVENIDFKRGATNFLLKWKIYLCTRLPY